MKIEQEVDSLIQKSGGGYREWYVGIAIDPRKRLFDGHNVDEKRGVWTYKDAGTEIDAREMMAAFLKKGCKGGLLTKDSSRHVYFYKMTRTTHG